MKRYNIYYETPEEILEKKNLSQEEMQSFLDNLSNKNEQLIRLSKIQDERDDEER